MFDFNITLRLGPEFYAAVDKLVAAIHTRGQQIMNDLTVLKGKMDALAAKAAETNTTLAGLAQAIIDLKASGDVQAGIDALVVQAQGIIDAQTAAEDAADDQLPT